MMKIISCLISSIFIAISSFYSIRKLNYDVDLRKSFISMLIISLSSFLPFAFCESIVFRPLITFFAFYTVNYLIFRNNFLTSLLKTFCIHFSYFIFEIIITLLLLLIFKSFPNTISMINTDYGIIVMNLFVSLLTVAVSYFNLMMKCYNVLCSKTFGLHQYNSIIVLVITFFILVMLFYNLYYKYYSNQLFMYIGIIFLLIFYSVIIFMILNTKSKYEKIRSKYSLSLENIKEYEEMVNQYRVLNHENKNQLLLIRNMESSEEVKNYIDKLIDNKEKDDTDIYNKVKSIPSNSLRAVLYSKMLLMKNKKIHSNILIERKVSSKDFINIDKDTMLDICNIINIFIDNAIEEVSNIKEKQILIEVNHQDTNIEIVISNTCNNKVNVNHIFETGYTTKCSGHGYGLSLVQDTIKKNNKLSNKVECSGNVFTQYLYIETKM